MSASPCRLGGIRNAWLLVVALGLCGCAPTRERFTVAPPPQLPSAAGGSQTSRATPQDIPPGGREGRMNENRCVEVFMENIAMTHSMRNRCDFALNVAYNIIDPGGIVGMDHTLSRQMYFTPHGAQVLDIIRRNPRASVHFWACHYSQLPVYRGNRPASDTGQQVEIWRCVDPKTQP